MAELQPNTTYYVRGYATTDVTTAYSEQKTFKTNSGLPVVNTGSATSTINSISIMSEVIENGGYTVTERGVCYSAINAEPTLTDGKVISGSGNGTFSVSINNLEIATTYYVRAYATNNIGTAYGQIKTIKTSNGAATLFLGTINNITASSAIGNVTVIDVGGATLQECGICWSTTPTPSTADSKTKASGKQLNMAYPCHLTDLQPNTTYYVCGYAITDIVTTYSSQKTFTTQDGLPVVTTSEVTMNGQDITTGGNVVDDGGFPVTAKGICYGNIPNPDLSSAYSHTLDGSGNGYFTSNLGSSISGTIYVRAYATNENGTSFGKQITVNVDYLKLPSFAYNGHIYKVAPSANGGHWDDADAYCNGLNLYSFSDWRMPTKDELYQMYTEKNSIGGFANSSYWSSTYYISNYVYYYTIDFYSGQIKQWTATGYRAYVRPIRQDK